MHAAGLHVRVGSEVKRRVAFTSWDPTLACNASDITTHNHLIVEILGSLSILIAVASGLSAVTRVPYAQWHLFPVHHARRFLPPHLRLAVRLDACTNARTTYNHVSTRLIGERIHTLAVLQLRYSQPRTVVRHYGEPSTRNVDRCIRSKKHVACCERAPNRMISVKTF